MTAITAITGQIDAALSRLQPGAAEAAGNSFAEVFDSVAASVTAPLRKAEEAAIAGIEGKMPVQDVVSAVMEAERGLQMAIAIRDKVVGAYLEISRMQI